MVDVVLEEEALLLEEVVVAVVAVLVLLLVFVVSDCSASVSCLGSSDFLLTPFLSFLTFAFFFGSFSVMMMIECASNNIILFFLHFPFYKCHHHRLRQLPSNQLI